MLGTSVGGASLLAALRACFFRVADDADDVFVPLLTIGSEGYRSNRTVLVLVSLNEDWSSESIAE